MQERKKKNQYSYLASKTQNTEYNHHHHLLLIESARQQKAPINYSIKIQKL
jgi:hypothetical protein